MPQLLCILAASILAGSVLAAAAAEPDLQEAVETLHREAMEQHDLWTCLQLEAYAERRSLRLPSCLGRGGRVIGDPMLSFPEPVIDVVERGDHQVVVAGSRYYPVDLDGRPLAISRPLPFTPELLAASPDGRYLAMAALTGPPGALVLRLAVQDLQRNVRRWQRAEARAAVPAVATERLYQIAVSADGSTIGVIVRRVGLPPELRSLVVATDQSATSFPGFSKLSDIGAQGSWVLATDQLGVSGCFAAGSLVQANRAGWRMAAGAGAAVLVDGERHCHLVAPDGSIAPWEPAGITGTVQQVLSVGDHLAVTVLLPADATVPMTEPSGVLQESVDLFAAPAPAPAPAPTVEADSADLFAVHSQDPAPVVAIEPPAPARQRAVALYAWSKLVQQAQSPPVQVFPGHASPADTHGRALWLCHGSRLALLDLNGDTPEHRVVTELPGAVEWMWPSHSAYIARLTDQSAVIIDHHGKPLYHLAGAAEFDLRVISRGAALVWTEADDVVQRLLVLDPDPAKRRECVLAEWPAPFTHEHAHASDDGSSLVVGTASTWLAYDTTNGAVRERHVGPQAPALPEYEAEGENLARMIPTAQRSHLIPIADPAAASSTPWAVSDALLAGRTVLVLDAAGHLRGEGRNGWQELGHHPGLRRFVDVPGENGLYLGPDDHQALVQLVPGRGLMALPEPRRTQARSHGSWQVDGLRYTAPGSASTLSWDRSRLGFAPQRLQGEGRTDLLAFLPGIILQLDPRTAAALGVDDDTVAERRAEAEARRARARARAANR